MAAGEGVGGTGEADGGEADGVKKVDGDESVRLVLRELTELFHREGDEEGRTNLLVAEWHEPAVRAASMGVEGRVRRVTSWLVVSFTVGVKLNSSSSGNSLAWGCAAPVSPS